MKVEIKTVGKGNTGVVGYRTYDANELFPTSEGKAFVQSLTEDWTRCPEWDEPAYVAYVRKVKRKMSEMEFGTVKNPYGVSIDFNTAVSFMDDELCEKLNGEIAPCSDQEFFTSYCYAHEEKFGEEWELAKQNPTY